MLPNIPGVFGLIRDHNAAITAGGHMLGALEAKTGSLSDLTHHFPLVAAEKTLRVILNEDQTILRGKLQQSIIVRRQSVNADRHDGFGQFRDLTVDIHGVDAEGIGINVCENWYSPALYNSKCRCGRSKVRDDDLVARTNPSRKQAAQHGSRA